MFLFDYIKKAAQQKKYGAFIYIIVSLALNIVLFWLVYEKLLKQPNGFLWGIVISFVALLICSTPASTVIFNLLNREAIEKNEKYARTYELFEIVKSRYVAAGYIRVKYVKLKVFKEKEMLDPKEFSIKADNQIEINSLCESLPEKLNIGRFAVAMDWLMYGYGYGDSIVLGANAIYLILFIVLLFIRIISSGLYNLIGLSFLAKIGDFENNIISKVFGLWPQLGYKLCRLTIPQELQYETRELFSEEKDEYVNDVLTSFGVNANGDNTQ